MPKLHPAQLASALCPSMTKVEAMSAKSPSLPSASLPAPVSASQSEKTVMPKKKKRTAEDNAKMSVADFVKNNLATSE